MLIEAGPLLKNIDTPDDLKKVSREKLHQVWFSFVLSQT